MFTLKLYQNGPLPPNGRTVILECSGVWVDHCSDGVKFIRAFKKTVGVQDDDNHEFYVGGDPDARKARPDYVAETDCIVTGTGGNYFGWGVLENALGKTTEMFR